MCVAPGWRRCKQSAGSKNAKSPSLSFFVDISFPHTTAEPRGLSPHDVSRRLSQSGHHRCRWVQDSLFSDRSPSHIAPLHRSFERFKIDRSLQVLPESCRCEISWNKGSRSPRSSETRDWEGFGGGRLNPTGRAFSRVSLSTLFPLGSRSQRLYRGKADKRVCSYRCEHFEAVCELL